MTSSLSGDDRGSGVGGAYVDPIRADREPTLAQAREWLAQRRLASSHKPTPLQARTHRVNQLDAVELDEELIRMLKEQLNRCFTYMHQNVLDRFEPEIQALLRLVFFSFSIVSDTPSPGNLLQNLRYRSSSLRKRVTYTFLSVIVPYVHSRIDRMMLLNAWSDEPDNSWRRRLYLLVRRFEALTRALSLGNFFVFVYGGRYRSLIDRALRMQLFYIHPDAPRHVAFDFMNQQLLWQGCSEFLLFMLPLLNVPKMRRFFRRLFLRLPWFQREGGSGGCPVCGIDPIPIPFVASCSHIFCYYCLKASRVAEKNFRCPTCDLVVTSERRFDVQCTRAS